MCHRDYSHFILFLKNIQDCSVTLAHAGLSFISQSDQTQLEQPIDEASVDIFEQLCCWDFPVSLSCSSVSYKNFDF